MMRSFLRKNGSMRNFNMRPTLTELERVSTQGLRSVYECSRAGFLHIQTRQKTTNSKAAKTVPIAGCSSTTPIPSTTSSPTQRDLVYSIMATENVYHPEVLEKEVNSFFEDIDLPMTYYLKFSPQQISNHIHAMIAAKEIAKSSGKDSIEFNVEGREHAMFVCSFDHESVLRMEHLVGNYIHLTPSGYSCSIFSFHSKKGTIGISKASQPSQDIIIYIATRDAFVSTCEEAADADDIGVLATKEFLSNRPAEVRSGYQEVLRVMKRENIPIFHSFNVANGHTHFTFAAGNSYVTDSHNILPLISRVASEYGLSFENKVVETFANGTVVFSYHAPREFNPSVMSTFLFSLEQLLFTPASLHRMLTVGAPVTLQKIDSSALLYFHMAISFADYFVSQHSDEYAALLVETAKSPRANFHLCNLQKKLIMDSVTYNRVVETITNYAGLCLEIYEDFLSKTKPVDNKKSPPCATSQELNVELFEKARKQVLNSLDLEILQCFILLNSVIRHTNFHHSRKPSVCVELNEQFLKGTPFVSQNSPVHAVIMSLGIGHQGFLTMRSPISRCSLDLLMPKTADEEKRLVSELYFINDVSSKLMHSKTKDVAESGAGCTVVISHLGHHARKAIAMQFVTSVLNVVAETQGLPQGQCLRAPSVVLWGPGVNSYDLMDDITIVARRFANPYANAIAAGKSRKFGGLTDLRAVSASRFEIERFVYEKMGLQPEKMTKIITGSIDEQRTLDELQFSQERIIAVIDRNGVLYDASGLRTEVLVDLGKAKRSILEYPLSDHKSDVSNATTQSFPILQFLIARDQKGFSDPFTGEQVTSGDYFCERFLAHPHVSADTVVLCEKRYSPVSRYEVSNFVHSSTQEPKFRLLFEGVDMPLTEDTRSVLERKGVVVLKDTITNKGTGMRSSYEILVALCLSTDDFNSNMIAKNKSLTASDAGQDSRFYSEYANDVVEIIRNAARRDIELVWREHNDPVRNAQNLTRSHITNEISKKVTRLSSQLMALDFLSHKPSIYKDILKNVIPPTLIKRDGIEQIIQRLPEGYKRSLLVKAFTNAYVQRHGLAQDEFCFYEFSKEYFNTGSR